MTDHIDFVSDPDREPTESPKSETNSELDQLRLDLEQAKDRSLRALAELENYRARVNRQALEERKYANIDLLRELLPVWDNIGRALDAVDKTHNLDTLVEGIKLVDQQFIDVLHRFHCDRIEALHQPFDPNFHASIAQVPNEEYPANIIVHESQIGFKLHDRVVRPSQVVLSSGKPAN